MTCIGIDLGTSNSVVAYLDRGVPTLIPNALGDTLTPSAVSLGESGEIMVGRAAIDRLVTHPGLTAAGFKRLMGTSVTVRLGERAFRPEELSALVLRSLKLDAEAFLGRQVNRAVISVPAYFAEPQRRATLAAARLAGLDAIRLINEPTAAALAYGLEDRREGEYLVLDLGGGTFDVSLLNKFDGIMEIRASAGDTNLGGNDFRDLIASLCLSDQKLRMQDLDAEDRARLLRAAERIKCGLTNEDRASETILLKGAERDWALNRDRFEESAERLINRLRAPVMRVISDTSSRAEDIDEIILVGGAARMPLMRAVVTRLFHRFPRTHARPDHLIGLGAAVQAGLVERDAALDDIVMTDVCPHTLGTGSLDSVSGQRVMDPIIERNTVIPTSRIKFYYPVENRQKEIRFDILQGENIRPEMNVLIGEVMVRLPGTMTVNDAVTARFTYDLSGALEVEIVILKTGQVYRQVFAGQSGLSAEEIESRFQRLSELKIAPRDQAVNHMLVARAERLFAESIGDRRASVHNALMHFLAALDSTSIRDHTRTREEFEGVLDHLERSSFH